MFCFKGHHEAFISWAEYLKNQETLMHNRNQLGETVRGAARAGKGLLAGLLRCGHCGKKMRVRYGGRSNRNATAVYYQCTASQGQPEEKQLCSLCGGFQVEQAVVDAVLASLAPVRLEALAQAADQLAETRAQKRRRLELELERARFEAGRRKRQYDAVEPENRLVARTLERRWNEALERAAALEQALSLDPQDAASRQDTAFLSTGYRAAGQGGYRASDLVLGSRPRENAQQEVSDGSLSELHQNGRFEMV